MALRHRCHASALIDSALTSPAIEIEQLALKLGGKAILHDVSLCIEPGALYVLLGRNGAGKTTTLRAVLGLQKIASGRIRLFGHDVSQLAKLPQALGVALDPPGLDDTLSVRQNLELARIRGGIKGGRGVDEVLELVGMTHRQHNYGSRLSHGQGRRAAVARALLGDPELLLLDEPLSGLDPQGVERMLELFKHLCENEGKTVVLSSHHLREVQHICTHVGLIDDGHTLLQGRTGDLLDSMPSYLVVRGDDLPAAATAIESLEGVSNLEIDSEEVVAKISKQFNNQQALARLQLANVPVSEFFVRRSNLVSVFQNAIEAYDKGVADHD
jgi:ABC-type multidrug transport system ATPase subunit